MDHAQDPRVDYAPRPLFLAADDSASTLVVTNAILAGLPGSPEVVNAADGKEAVRAATEFLPHVIVMDWQMPVMNGLEAIRVLKADPRTMEIPIIMLTGVLKETDNLRMAIDAGALDFVRKPVDPLELQARVGGALRLSLSMRAMRDKNEELQLLNKELRTALDEIETLTGLLTGLLPICCHCREVRSDDGYWSDLESYLRARVHTQFSHGICPPCMEEHYSDVLSEVPKAFRREPAPTIDAT